MQGKVSRAGHQVEHDQSARRVRTQRPHPLPSAAKRRAVVLALAALLVPTWAHSSSTGRSFDTTSVSSIAAAQPPRDIEGDGSPRHDAIVALLNPRGFACSGVLVAERWLLTARHCAGVDRAVFGSDVRELRAVRKIVTFKPGPFALDLALAQLDSPAPVSPYHVYLGDEPPRKVRVVGFGCTDAECRIPSGRRTFFDVPLRSGSWGCEPRDAVRLGCRPSTEMVLSRWRASDTCTGDSGGAALSFDGKRWNIVGITSRAVADTLLRCGDGGIYVRVGAISAWLKDTIKT